MDHYYTNLDGIDNLIHQVAGKDHNWNKMANFDVTKDKRLNTYYNASGLQFGIARAVFSQAIINPEHIRIKNDHILAGQARKPRNLLPKAVTEPVTFQIDAFDLKNNYGLKIQIDRISELNKNNIAMPKQAFSFSIKEWGEYPELKRQGLNTFLAEQKAAGSIEKIPYSPDHTVGLSFLKSYMNHVNQLPAVNARTTVSALQNTGSGSIETQSYATKSKPALPSYPHYLKKLPKPINVYKKNTLSLSDKVIAAAIFAGVDTFTQDDLSYIVSGHTTDNSLKQTVRVMATGGQVITRINDTKNYSLIALPKDMSPDIYENALNGFEGKDWTKEKVIESVQKKDIIPLAQEPWEKMIFFSPSKESRKKDRPKKGTTHESYYMFTSVPPYLGPDQVPQSDKKINLRKYPQDITNSDKIIAAAICHASLGEPFRSIDLTKTIKEGVADTSIQTFVGKVVEQGFLKVVRVEGSNKYLTIAEMPADMNEELYYKIIKDFKGIPQETGISLDEVPVSLSDNNDLEAQSQNNEISDYTGEKLVEEARNILMSGSEEQLVSLDIEPNKNPTEIETRKAQPFTQTVESNLKPEEPAPPVTTQTYAQQHSSFHVTPPVGIMTDIVQVNSVQAMALKNIGSRSGQNNHVTISQYAGSFPMQFGQVTVHATGRSTHIDFKGIDSSITIVNFDSMVQEKLPYVIIKQPEVQPTSLNGYARTAELFQQMKYLLVPPVNNLDFIENEMAVSGLQQVYDNRQLSLASQDIFTTVSSLTQGLTL